MNPTTGVNVLAAHNSMSQVSSVTYGSGNTRTLAPFPGPIPGTTPDRPQLALVPDTVQLNRLATLLDNRMRIGPETFPVVAVGWRAGLPTVAQYGVS